MVSNWKQLWNETVAGLAAGLAAIEFKRARALLVPPREPATACSATSLVGSAGSAGG